MGKNEIRREIEQTQKLTDLIKKETDLSNSITNNDSGFIHLDENEKMIDLTQDVIKGHVNQQTLEKAYNIVLENGTYEAKYDNTGRHLLLAEQRGQLAMFDVKTKNLFFDINVQEKITNSIFLHNELFVAVSQRKSLYVYDHKGREVHCVRKHKNVTKMDFLQYHFLLATISSDGLLRYLDTSTGKLIAEIETGEVNTCITKNPSNGVIFLGADKGHVTLWTPNDQKYVAKVFCHKSVVSDVQIDRFGHLMVTNGSDKQIKVWDIRNMFEPLNVIDTKTTNRNLRLSQKNMLACSYKDRVYVHKDIDVRNTGENVALQEAFRGRIVTSLDYCPFEDILTVGHNRGVSNIIVPGSGDPSFDSYEESPFRSKRDRQEIEVRRLLEKVPYKLIHLKQGIGHISDK